LGGPHNSARQGGPSDDRHQAAPPVIARERNGTAWLTSRVPLWL